MRGGLADGFGFVGSMDSVAGDAEAHPARAHRIARPRQHRLAIVMIGRIAGAPRDSLVFVVKVRHYEPPYQSSEGRSLLHGEGDHA